MNICMISPYPPQTGGVPVHTESLVKMLSKGHKIFLITYGRLGRKSSGNVEVIEVPIINMKFLRGMSFFLGALFKLRSTAKKNKIDIIHSQFMHPPGTVASFYRKICRKKIKFFVTAHGSDLLSLAGGMFGRMIIKSVGNSCDRLICVSEYLAETAESLGTDKKKISVIYNGLSDMGLPKESKKSLRKHLKLPDKNIITFAGKLTEAKGADIFLILAEHLSYRKGMCFLVVGDGPQRKSLEHFCEKFGLEDSVVFTGPKDHDETLRYMKASDVIVVPSRVEGFGLTALEAMRLGVPVVASPAGALPEIMPGLAVTENLPHIVVKILESSKFRNAVVKGNRKISQGFTLEKMCDETESLYRKSA